MNANTVPTITLQPGVDWSAVITEIHGKGHGKTAIAQAVGVARSTIIDWLRLHYEPRHDQGERLLALWRAVTGKAAEAAPRCASGGAELQHALSAWR